VIGEEKNGDEDDGGRSPECLHLSAGGTAWCNEMGCVHVPAGRPICLAWWEVQSSGLDIGQLAQQ
jgi:hypothetical protein